MMCRERPIGLSLIGLDGKTLWRFVAGDGNVQGAHLAGSLRASLGRALCVLVPVESGGVAPGD